MRKTVSVIVAIMIVFSFFLAEATPVLAESSGSNPSATPLTGDTVFTATPTDPSAIVGAYLADDGLYLPTGFKKKENQFGGPALVLTGIKYGTQKTCFAFPAYTSGWRGAIYQWNTDKWIKLPTEINKAQGDTQTSACATTYGDGTYALIIGVTVDMQSSLPACTLKFGRGVIAVDTGTQVALPASDSAAAYNFVMGLFPSSWLGKTVSYKILATPASAAWGPGLADSGQVTLGAPASPDDYHFWSTKIFYLDFSTLKSLQVQIFLPTCQGTYPLEIGG